MDKAKLTSSLQQIKAIADECLASLGDSAKSRRATKEPASASPNQDIRPSFHLNPLAFMKRYGRGLRGPQRFTLLVARLSGGKVGQQTAHADLKKNWNQMKSVMGGKFNPAHGNRAKANGWVDTKKRGVYTLAPEWKDIFKNTNG